MRDPVPSSFSNYSSTILEKITVYKTYRRIFASTFLHLVSSKRVP